jgi:hypothetical protein
MITCDCGMPATIARVRGGLVAFLCRVCIRLGKAAA